MSEDKRFQKEAAQQEQIIDDKVSAEANGEDPVAAEQQAGMEQDNLNEHQEIKNDVDEVIHEKIQDKIIEHLPEEEKAVTKAMEVIEAIGKEIEHLKTEGKAAALAVATGGASLGAESSLAAGDSGNELANLGGNAKPKTEESEDPRAQRQASMSSLEQSEELHQAAYSGNGAVFVAAEEAIKAIGSIIGPSEEQKKEAKEAAITGARMLIMGG